MRTVRFISAAIGGLCVICVGCESTNGGSSLADNPRHQAPQRTAGPTTKPSGSRMPFTADNNPTTRGGRGDPSLDDFFRPAAWIYVDGREGRFTEIDGRPQAQWVIDGPVSSSPTFRVEVYEPLLGVPKNFSCVFETVATSAGSTIAYSIKAKDGTFDVGRDYSLLSPGSNFVVRNRKTGDVVSSIAPLASGTYAIIAGVRNDRTSREGLAITYFTVGEEAGE